MPFEAEIAVLKLEKYKSPSIHEILGELIQAGAQGSLSKGHKLIHSILNNEKLPDR
jgi:hypothetical protein